MRKSSESSVFSTSPDFEATKSDKSQVPHSFVLYRRGIRTYYNILDYMNFIWHCGAVELRSTGIPVVLSRPVLAPFVLPHTFIVPLMYA